MFDIGDMKVKKKVFYHYLIWPSGEQKNLSPTTYPIVEQIVRSGRNRLQFEVH